MCSKQLLWRRFLFLTFSLSLFLYIYRLFNISIAGVTTLCAKLCDDDVVTSVELGGNKISNVGVKGKSFFSSSLYLSLSLSFSFSLSLLFIVCGNAAIAKLIAANMCINKIDFYDCCLDSNGIATLKLMQNLSQMMSE